MGTTRKPSSGPSAANAANAANAAGAVGAGGVKRYPPWLQKALRIKEQSERFWAQQQPQEPQKPQESQKPDAAAPPESSTKSYASVWEAIAGHDVGFVKEFVESDLQHVFVRREGVHDDLGEDGGEDGGGGVTLLHEAATHGALEIVTFLISALQSRFSDETCRHALNCVDTVYSQTTPLIAACRSSEGMMNDRLEIVRLVVLAGSDVAHQDAHGDNVLHWCARESHAMLLRFFLKETDAGVAAIFVENCKREKPLDIAKRQLSRKPSVATTNAFNLLRHVDRKCNIRMKMQVLRRFQSEQQAERNADESLQLQAALESASAMLDTADRDWKDALVQAEKHRQMAEDAYITQAAETATRAASEWLESKDGKNFMKKQLPIATQELKLEVQMGKLVKPKDMKKAAVQRVLETYCREKEAAAKRQAVESFRAKTPSYSREANTPPAKLKAVLRI